MIVAYGFGVKINGMARELFEVKCPCCQAELKIDGELRAVIAHQEHVKPPAIEDLTAAVAKLKGEAGRRDEVFRKSFETEKNQGQVLNSYATGAVTVSSQNFLGLFDGFADFRHAVPRL